MGDPLAAARRLQTAEGLTILASVEEAEVLADLLLRRAAMPAKAVVDATHVALAAVHRLDYLVTWNCTHIANATMRPRIEAVCREGGVPPPVICTPDELPAQEES